MAGALTPASHSRSPAGASSARSRLAATLRAPNWPGSLDRPEPAEKLGLDYDTAWTRSWPARVARAVLVDNVARPLTAAIARPTVIGLEHLDPIDGPVIFTPNHSSHLDTGVILCSLPVRLRHHTVVAAAADHFFDRRWKAALWSFGLASIPIERSKVNRRSSDLAAELLDDGWSLLIYPEGGRTPDGWGQEFHGGAAYLAKRAGVPVVPVHLRATRPLLPKGGSRLSPGAVEIRFGDPLVPLPGSGSGAAATARRRAPGVSRRVSKLPSPPSPTRPRATGGPPGDARRPVTRRRCGGPTPRPGAVPGSCPRAPARIGATAVAAVAVHGPEGLAGLGRLARPKGPVGRVRGRRPTSPGSGWFAGVWAGALAGPGGFGGFGGRSDLA